jgi:amino acid adenylation domain-containing protein
MGSTDPVRAATLGELCTAMAAREPHARALSDGDRTLSFGELEHRVASWAAELRRLGVGRDTRVVVLGDKQVQTPVACLAVCRAGGTYVPLDRNLPEARLSALIADADACVTIAAEDAPAARVGSPRLPLEAFAEPAGTRGLTERCDARFDDVAYIMYTSGSTGRPKGVQIEHRTILRFFHEHNRGARVRAGGRCMNTGPFHFDVSILDTFLPLYFGASVVLTPELPLASVLLSTLEAERISSFYAVGTILQAMTGDGSELDDYDLRALETLQTGAEVCDVALVNRWLSRVPGLRFLNSYGPTEVTVGCSQYVAPPGPMLEHDCPIGRPHAGCDMRLLAEDGSEIDQPGAIGELVIAGDQVMRGYWRRPEEDARAFINRNGRRFYRSGDHVFRDAVGLLHYVGRRDEELKVDGQRIHLSEVRQCLSSCPDVSGAAIGSFFDAGGKRRVGAAIIANEQVDAGIAQRIMTRLQECLMPAAVPRGLLFCASLPRLSSGKTDVKRCMQQLERAVLASGELAFILRDGVATPV